MALWDVGPLTVECVWSNRRRENV